MILSRQASIDMLAIRSAIEDMVMMCIGWPDSERFRVFVRELKIPQVPYPYITYAIGVPRQVVGHDEMRKIYDQHQAPGQEIINTLRNQRDIIVGFQAFSKSPVEGLDLEGYYSAAEYLNMIQDSIDLPSISDRLYTARLVFVDVLATNDLSSALGPIGQGRAVMDIRFRTAYTTSEKYGYIEKVIAPKLVWIVSGTLNSYSTVSAKASIVSVVGGVLSVTSTLSGS